MGKTRRETFFCDLTKEDIKKYEKRIEKYNKENDFSTKEFPGTLKVEDFQDRNRLKKPKL